MLRKVGYSMLCVVLAGEALPAAAAELQFANASDKAIHELYIVPQGQKEWGEDRLAGRQGGLARGETLVISELASGAYELRIVDADGEECEFDKPLTISADLRFELTAALWAKCSSH